MSVSTVQYCTVIYWNDSADYSSFFMLYTVFGKAAQMLSTPRYWNAIVTATYSILQAVIDTVLYSMMIHPYLVKHIWRGLKTLIVSSGSIINCIFLTTFFHF